MFQPPGPANPTLKLKTPSGSQMGSFSDPQPIPLRSAGRPKVLVLICTQPWLLAFVTVTCAWAPTANSNAQQRIDSQILNFFIGKLPPLENLATGEQFGCQRGGIPNSALIQRAGGRMPPRLPQKGKELPKPTMFLTAQKSLMFE